MSAEQSDGIVTGTDNASALRERADAGFVPAQVRLGMQLLFGGPDCEQDYALALHYLQQAAAAGAFRAQHVLGLAYLHGLGTERDHARAREMFEAAAARSDTLSAFELARLSAHEGALAESVRWYEVVLASCADEDPEDVADLEFVLVEARERIQLFRRKLGS